jgi:parallel beta-helix repeat protein
VRGLILFALLLACAPTEPETPMNRYTLAVASVAGFWSATGGTISPTGLYRADTVPGTYVVAYDSAGLHSAATVNVCAFAGLEVTPDSAAGLAVGDTVQVNGALETNCLTADTSITVLWESRDEAVATVVATGTQRGRITAVAAGETWVIGRDSLSTRFDSVYVCVEDYYLTDVAPATATIAIAGTQALTGTTTNCGAAAAAAVVTWTSRTPSVATVLTSGNQTATVTGVALGTAYIVGTRTPGGADSMLVTVTGPCAAGATTFTPGEDYQAKVNAQPAGTAFTLCAGTYPLWSVVPKSNQTFTGVLGYPSTTILSGSRQLTAWTASGSTWYATGQTQQGTATASDKCESGHAACGLPEDLWIDGVLQHRETSLAAVGSGKWYFDYAADRAYIGVNPSGKVIEIGVLPHAFSGSASGVTLKRLTIEKYATPAQAGSVQGDNAPNWTTDSLVVRKAHGTCLRMGNGWDVLRSTVKHCGQLGIAGGGTGSVVDGLIADSNKTIGYQVGFAGGASKFFQTTGLIVRNSFFRDNDGNGVWLDIDNIDYRVHHNTMSGNYGQGIFAEISADGQIDSNTVTNNGHRRGGTWLYGAGILIAHTRNVEVFGNTVSGNYNGIVGIQQDRGFSSKFGWERLLLNLNVHDNVICMARGKSGVGDGTGTGAFQGARNNDNWEDNDYTVPNTTGSFWTWNNASQTWAGWNGFGFDTPGGSRTAGSC